MTLQHSRKLDFRPLKLFARERLPRDWALREILLTEKDEIEVTEFIAKLDVWFRLLKIDASR